MSNLIEQLRAVVVTGEVDLSEMDQAYRDPETGEPVRLTFRLNWSRAQKERQRELGEETLEAQRCYVRLKELVGDDEAWREAKAEADRLSDENWRHWAAWWAEIFLMEVNEVVALADALPEQHWVWLTAKVASEADGYERQALKKASDAPSHTSGRRERKRRKSGSEPG